MALAPRWRHFRFRAFTLVEVLVGLALAVIAIGIILNTVSRQTVAVTRNRLRYQGVLQASLALEHKMELDASQDKNAPALGSTNPEDKHLKATVAVREVTADPRVEQIEVTIPYGPGLQCSMSAYRLRIRRMESKSNSNSDNTTNSTSNSTKATP